MRQTDLLLCGVLRAEAKGISMGRRGLVACHTKCEVRLNTVAVLSKRIQQLIVE